MSVLDQFSLDGRRALVTGAGRGLGRAMAQGLAEAGAAVALVARNADQLADAAQEIGHGSVALVADLAEPDASAHLVDRAESALGGTIDIVLHSAGVQHRQPALELGQDDWERVLAVNLRAPFLLSQEVARRQLAAGTGGSHIFIGSLGSTLGLRNVIAYTASKSGVLGVVRTLALEWAEHGIRVNALGPGYLRTELTKALLDDPENRERIVGRTPMGRLGVPGELAGTAVFLASGASAFVTGQLIMVDGGWTAN